MFENIGRKIKILASVLTWIGFIVSIICTVVFTLYTENPSGLIILIVGTLISWLSSFLLYGFGELIEQTTIIAENTQNKSVIKKTQREDNFKKTQELHCEICGQKIESKPCKYCSQKLKLLKPLDELVYSEEKCPHCGENISVSENDINNPNFICPFCNMSLRGFFE